MVPTRLNVWMNCTCATWALHPYILLNTFCLQSLCDGNGIGKRTQCGGLRHNESALPLISYMYVASVVRQDCTLVLLDNCVPTTWHPRITCSIKHLPLGIPSHSCTYAHTRCYEADIVPDSLEVRHSRVRIAGNILREGCVLECSGLREDLVVQARSVDGLFCGACHSG